MNTDRKRIIRILNSAKDGHLSAETLKQLLQAKPIDPGHIPLPWPIEPVTEIKIKTTEELVILDYKLDPADILISIPGEQGYVGDIPVCVSKRKSNQRFSDLEPESHFIITVPEPISVLDIGKYSGPWKIKQIMQEDDFLY